MRPRRVVYCWPADWRRVPTQAAEESGWPTLPPVKIHVVYLGTGGAWPKPEFDAPGRGPQVRGRIWPASHSDSGTSRFVGGQLIRNVESEAREVGGDTR